ncbi:MAG: phosphoglucosamine mutase [Actinobacteria bacterium]|nr:phosphoglucosamine mutase [Actinomycetota bacterium]
MSGRLFGTDGVRGLANRDLTAELALSLAAAAAHVLGDSGGAGLDGPRPVAVVGRDPRASGEFLEAAVVAGLASAGVDVLLAGVLPTPAIAYLTERHGASLGVMLSASHNAMPDNGIKFFDAQGFKLPDAIEDDIEARLLEAWDRPVGSGVGRVRPLPTAGREYVDHVLGVVTTPLAGLSVIVDCANGAASIVSPEAMRRAGADVLAIHASPDGLNINEGCGSTHLDDLIAAVVEHGADIGIAHDGDADRCLAVDAEGNVIDGDQILAILATAMRDRGTLARDTVVATVMSNLGFRIAMEEQGITMVATAVGDRYVLEEMRERGFALGGEQSGHVVMLDRATTGDGVLTALALLDRMAETGSSLKDLAAIMRRLPQVLINVEGVDRSRLAESAEVAAVVEVVERELGAEGRVLLRPSGTEPLVRVMVEAPTAEAAQDAAEAIADAVRASLSISG